MHEKFIKPEWLDEFEKNSQKEIAVLNHWDGEITQFLVPMKDNEAALSWTFSNPVNEYKHEMIIKLTDHEAQTIFESKPLTGMIEDIRNNLSYPESVIRVTDRENSEKNAEMNYMINKTDTEKEFNDNMYKVAIKLEKGIKKRP